MEGKSLEYWNDPRSSIATVYKNNDMCYSLSGCHAAMLIIKHLISNPYKKYSMTDMHVLEFGSGTGRIARPLSFMFSSIFAYDPNEACTQLAQIEALPMQFSNIEYNTIIPFNKKFDIIVSINVLEHLNYSEQIQALNLMFQHATIETIFILWYHTSSNHKSLTQYFGSQCFKEDNIEKPNIAVKSFYPIITNIGRTFYSHVI